MLTQAIHATTPIRLPQAMHRDTVIVDIAGGQHDANVRAVWAGDRQTGRFWDASKDIAKDVLAHCLKEDGEVPDCCRDFLEEVLGYHAVRRAEFEAAA